MIPFGHVAGDAIHIRMEASRFVNAFSAFSLEHSSLSMTGRAQILWFHHQILRTLAVLRIVAGGAGNRTEVLLLSSINLFALKLGFEALVGMAAVAIGRSLAVVYNEAERLAVAGRFPHIGIPLMARLMARDTSLHTADLCLFVLFLRRDRHESAAENGNRNAKIPLNP
jgi:hypothetical protein